MLLAAKAQKESVCSHLSLSVLMAKLRYHLTFIDDDSVPTASAPRLPQSKSCPALATRMQQEWQSQIQAHLLFL